MTPLSTAPSFPVLRLRNRVIRLPEPEDAEAILAFYRANEEHLGRYSPFLENWLKAEYWPVRIEEARAGFLQDKNCYFFIFDGKSVLGFMHFFNIMRGSVQTCTLGYGLGLSAQGQGIMRDALRLTTGYMFSTLNLHRIEANYLPENSRSGKLLAALGFTEEGRAEEYLRIHGKWRGHIRCSLINRKWRE